MREGGGHRSRRRGGCRLYDNCKVSLISDMGTFWSYSSHIRLYVFLLPLSLIHYLHLANKHADSFKNRSQMDGQMGNLTNQSMDKLIDQSNSGLTAIGF